MVEQSGSQSVELTREEMHAAFPGEWVLARITKWRDTTPLTGVIVAHDKSDGEVATHLPRGAKHRKYYFFNKRLRGGIDIYPTDRGFIATANLPRALEKKFYPELHLR